MRRALLGVLVVLALGSAAVAVGWGYVKATGTEWDVCRDGHCTSAWWGVLALGLIAVLCATLVIALLRRARPASKGRVQHGDDRER